MTTGAAQTLWRSDRTLPGRRIMVCGSGPLNLQVALELAAGGAEVAMVAERAPAPFRRPWAALRMLAAGPRLTRQGFMIHRRLRRRGVPVRDRTKLLRIEPAGTGLTAWVRTGEKGETSVEVDSVCMNSGFEPQNELLRLLGAEMRYDAAFGHLRTRRSELLQTSVPGLFAVGDCAGLGGAPAARVEGRIAGRAAAAAAGFGATDGLPAELRELERHRRFQACLWRLYDVAPQGVAGLPETTPICRCEDIDLGALRAAMDERPGHAGTLKRSTRAGMGRCQGRYCAPVLARLIAETTGAPLDSRSGFAPRVPVRPTPLAAIQAVQGAFSVPRDSTTCPAPLDPA
jgi:NAD(P)H-nitrite reductase large subunit